VWVAVVRRKKDCDAVQLPTTALFCTQKPALQPLNCAAAGKQKHSAAKNATATANRFMVVTTTYS